MPVLSFLKNYILMGGGILFIAFCTSDIETTPLNCSFILMLVLHIKRIINYEKRVKCF